MDHLPKKQLGFGPLTAVIGSLLLFFGSQIFVGLAVLVVLALLGWSDASIETWFAGGNVTQFMLSASVAFVTLGLLFWYFSFRKVHPREIGLVKPRVRDIGYVLAGAGVYVLAYIFVVSLIAALIPALNTGQTQELGFQKQTVGNELFLIFISLVVLPPLVEEIVVRGFMFTGLRTKLAFWPAALVSSALFGLAHLLGGEGGSTIWIATIDTFILGVVLCYLREKSASLWPAIGLHALKNFIAFMALFVFKV